ncbi:hypothetical protein [Actinomadura sp. WMMB 499]|uniref:hypothetical protein n=1 Tax=Actinomadura sp. WMMB 499 TaxID=1219491 RepID=UPI0012475BB9|nr:hypothetical protein [Actinomadura sp. WMMB 499]QFG24524.1 hypothetical protein F7P10_28735 [Actinomadura sp. WMMB 499]
MNNVSNPPPSSGGEGRWRAAPDVIVRRVGLLADLAAALVVLGLASRLVLEVNGGVALSALVGRRIVTVAVVQDERGGSAYVWGRSARFPAGAGVEMTRRAAAALAAGVR